MDKTRILLGVVLLGSILMAGCGTAVGFAKGVAFGVESTAKGIGSDAKNAYDYIMEADEWIKKNMW